MSLTIPDGSLADYIAELKPYQQNTLNALLKQNEPEKVAELYISANGPQNNVPFGGTRDTKPFWDRFKAELRKFVCDEESYAEDKKRLADETKATRALLISSISAAIGAAIGYPATVLVPAVAVMLGIVAKIGIKAYCNVA
ncbi:MAG: hypothetical protein FJ264_11040 [Planctomycetes bacterium]|nr:hypothetical protein [Planctomycetota bacterium]